MWKKWIFTFSERRNAETERRSDNEIWQMVRFMYSQQNFAYVNPKLVSKQKPSRNIKMA